MSDPALAPAQPLSASTAQREPESALAPQPDQQQSIEPELQQLQQQQHQQQDEHPDIEDPLLQHQRQAPPFQPLFTLVTDTTTGATHHAHVHYIFSDDEPDLLTDALGQYSTQQQQQQQTASSSSGSTSAKPAPPPTTTTTTTTDRAIVLDLVPKPPTSTSASFNPAIAPAYEVAWASSLSADWAVVSAKINPMSADDNDTDATAATPAPAAHSADGTLMLRIEGVGVAGPPPPPPPPPPRRKASPQHDLSSGSSSGVGQQQQPAAQQQEDYSAIVDEFEKRMVVLRRVLEAGRERQLKTAVGGDGPGEQPPVAEALEEQLANRASAGHEPQPVPLDAPPPASGSSRQLSDGSSGEGHQAGSKTSSGGGGGSGAGGHTEWEQQPVA